MLANNQNNDSQDTLENQNSETQDSSEYSEPQTSDENQDNNNSQSEDNTSDNWEVRAKYHQSRADKLESELNELKVQVGNNPLDPIVNEIVSNPEALKVALDVAHKQEPSQPVIRKPEKPNRDRKSTRLNSSHTDISRMPSSA